MLRICLAIALSLNPLLADAGAPSPASVSPPAASIAALLTGRLAEDAASRALAPALRQAADYYSGFPELAPLFQTLARTPFSIAYAADQHGTSGTWSRLTIRFDPLSAAQYRFREGCARAPAHCLAAPADVLLHELLHVAQLGRGYLRDAPLYPFAAEQSIIDQEARLFAAMSARDGKPRPLRVEHRGRAVRVTCALCVK